MSRNRDVQGFCRHQLAFHAQLHLPFSRFHLSGAGDEVSLMLQSETYLSSLSSCNRNGGFHFAGPLLWTFGGCQDFGGGVPRGMLEARSSPLKAGSKALARILVRTIRARGV